MDSEEKQTYDGDASRTYDDATGTQEHTLVTPDAYMASFHCSVYFNVSA